ncbi:hypothetical protein KIPB_014053, partial [Kipferlia bialata]|eukprot:g14053.t1
MYTQDDQTLDIDDTLNETVNETQDETMNETALLTQEGEADDAQSEETEDMRTPTYKGGKTEDETDAEDDADGEEEEEEAIEEEEE